MEQNKEWKECNAQVFWGEIASTDHLVQIYDDVNTFLNTLGRFAASGFVAGDAVIIIATAEHLKALEMRLQLTGLDINTLKMINQYIPVNAKDALAKFMVNDVPDETLFKEFVSSLISRARKNSGRVRAFGEMVAILWDQGNKNATIELEQLWNRFCQTEAFCLFCAYPKKGFSEDASDSLQDICTSHSKVLGGWNNSSTKIFYKQSV
ncbi:MAG TPA: MEDS domain-containing protein [Bacteroidia bacterium]|nr:MEDS domain-containing protein [Bacteroidia bacterium]